MPFIKIYAGKNKGKYRSPHSGRVMTKAQVRAYYAKKKKNGKRSTKRK